MARVQSTSVLTFSLNSGSNGNAIYVEADGVALMFDAGLSAVEARRRMKVHGRDPADVDALIISHEHSDHISGAGVWHRKFGTPLYVTPMTLSAADPPLGRLRDVRWFMSGQTLEFGRVRVHSIPTPHDARDPHCFVVEYDGRRLGILTDLGHVFGGLAMLIAELDAAYLESNYDPDMLELGPYPQRLKQRIRGPHGHLSNVEAADLAAPAARRRLKWIAAAHLSEENNTPRLALKTHRQRIGRYFDVRLAPRYGPSEMFEV